MEYIINCIIAGGLLAVTVIVVEEIIKQFKKKQVMKQTAVNYLIEQLKGKSQSITWNEIFDKAKEMEKQDIENAFNAGFNYANDKSGNIPNFEDFIKQYYNETFKK